MTSKCKRYVRMAAITVCLMLLFISLCSVGAPHHECLGKRCNMCCLFDIVKKILQCLVFAICGICATSLSDVLCFRLHTSLTFQQRLTPTQMKVRLLN